MLHHPDPATRYHNRAEELRTIAKTIKDKKHRKDMEEWAKECDQMAEMAELMSRPWQATG